KGDIITISAVGFAVAFASRFARHWFSRVCACFVSWLPHDGVARVKDGREGDLLTSDHFSDVVTETRKGGRLLSLPGATRRRAILATIAADIAAFRGAAELSARRAADRACTAPTARLG